MDKSTARVNEAVAIAVRRTLDAKPNVENRNAFGHAIGKRIQGTYGSELRRLADAQPLLSAHELFCAVVAKAEFPYDTEAAGVADTITAGARDRARKRRYGEPVDLSIPIPDDISERVAELRATVLRAEVTCGCDLSNPKRQEIPADPAWMHKRGCAFWTAERDWRPERAVVDRENLRVVPPEVYAAADEGRRMFQANRRARLDAAK